MSLKVLGLKIPLELTPLPYHKPPVVPVMSGTKLMGRVVAQIVSVGKFQLGFGIFPFALMGIIKLCKSGSVEKYTSVVVMLFQLLWVLILVNHSVCVADKNDPMYLLYFVVPVGDIAKQSMFGNNPDSPVEN